MMNSKQMEIIMVEQENMSQIFPKINKSRWYQNSECHESLLILKDGLHPMNAYKLFSTSTLKFE